MYVAKRTSETTFDVLGIAETNTSIYRNKSIVRISWVNQNGELERYEKSTPMSLSRGSYLRLKGDHLSGTGDKRKCVAVLLVPFETAAQTKTIDGKTAKLLPVSFNPVV